jgi:hypothetical protein
MLKPLLLLTLLACPFSPVALADSATYQMGEAWGPTRARDVEPKTALVLRAIQTTLRIGPAGAGATGIYLGKFAGKHLVATNHHVAKMPYMLGRKVGFPIVNVIADLSFEYQT